MIEPNFYAADQHDLYLMQEEPEEDPRDEYYAEDAWEMEQIN